jgi:hypothetical protein
VVGEVGLEPTKAYASGFTVRPLCRSGHSPKRVILSTEGGLYRSSGIRLRCPRNPWTNSTWKTTWKSERVL